MMAHAARRAALPLVLVALFLACVGVGLLALATQRPIQEAERLMLSGIVTMVAAMTFGMLGTLAVVIGEGADDDEA